MSTTTSQIKDIERLISDAILEHRLIPGQHLNEVQLAKGFGVSRSVVRVALISVENEGLVKIEQNRGVFVRKASLEEATHLFQALAALEKTAVDVILGSDRAVDPVGLKQLRAIHREQRAAQASGRVADSVKLAISFHLQFISLTKNPFLIDTNRKLLMQYRLVTAVFRTSVDHCALEDQHQKMLALLTEGSNAKLKRLIETHWGQVVMGHAAPISGLADLWLALKPDGDGRASSIDRTEPWPTLSSLRN